MVTASSESPSATTWARNHVVPIAAANQATVPNAKKVVATSATPRSAASRRHSRQASPTSTAPSNAAIRDAGVAMPMTATKGRSTTAGSGGNGRMPNPG